MRWRDVGTLALWHLHHATGRGLAEPIIRMRDRGLEAHLFAVRSGDDTPSVAVLGLDTDGVSRAYAEVVFVIADTASMAAWWILKADDTIARARQKLVEVDAISRGEPVSKPDDTRKS